MSSFFIPSHAALSFVSGIQYNQMLVREIMNDMTAVKALQARIEQHASRPMACESRADSRAWLSRRLTVNVLSRSLSLCYLQIKIRTAHQTRNASLQNTKRCCGLTELQAPLKTGAFLVQMLTELQHLA
mmetsp:Transcript_103020/g.276778  ORF Transcript_103020/g.276778 Transcript_103020/m.276778 type:complete len:129 (+) Transcript_103020:1348-1734(+)